MDLKSDSANWGWMGRKAPPVRKPQEWGTQTPNQPPNQPRSTRTKPNPKAKPQLRQLMLARRHSQTLCFAELSNYIARIAMLAVDRVIHLAHFVFGYFSG